MGKIIAVLIVLVLMVGCGSYESKMKSVGDDFNKIIQVDPRELTSDKAVSYAGKLSKLHDKVSKLTPPEKYEYEHEEALSMLENFALAFAHMAIGEAQGVDFNESLEYWKISEKNIKDGNIAYENAKKLLDGDD